MPGPSNPQRYPWRRWDLPTWEQYRADQLAQLERTPDHKPTRENLRLADLYIAAHKEAQKCVGTPTVLSKRSSGAATVTQRASLE